MSKNLEYFTRIRSIFKNDKLSASFSKLLNFKLGTRSESKCEDRSNNKKSNAEIQLVKLTKFGQVDENDNDNSFKKEKELILKHKKHSQDSSNLTKENMKTFHSHKTEKSENDIKINKNHDREEKAHLLNFVLKSSRHDDKFKRLVKNAIPPSKSINTKQLR